VAYPRSGPADHSRVDERGRRLDLNRLLEAADGELDVDADVEAGVDADARPRCRGEAGQRGVDPVVTDRHVGECVEAVGVGHRPPLDVGSDVGERHVNARQHATGVVLDHARHLRRVELCV
jgi:hypothetical protein